MHMGPLARGQATHIENASRRPLSDTALCRMSRTPRVGNRRTGAHRPHERVVLGDVIFCFSDEVVDATVDCVPVASSRVTRVVFGAQTLHVGLARNDGRALAGLLVVEAKKGQRADTSGRAQRECCEHDQTEASSAKRGPHTPECPQGRCYVINALRRCARMHARRCPYANRYERIRSQNILRTRERCREQRRHAMERPYRSS